MPKKAWIYMLFVILAGIAIFVESLLNGWDHLTNLLQNNIWLIISMLILSAISRSCPLYLRNDQAFDISVISTVALYLCVGTRITIILYVVSTLITFEKCADGTVKSLYNMDLKKTLFNVANIVLSIAIPGLLCHVFGVSQAGLVLPNVLLKAIIFSVGTYLTNALLSMTLFCLMGMASASDAFHQVVGLMPNVLAAMPIGLVIALIYSMNHGVWLVLLMLLPLLLALVLVITAIVPAYATGDGNFDGGGGSMGDGTKTNYWNPGMDGVRVSVIHADSQAVTGTVFDLTNKVPSTGLAHFGKVSKLSYNTGKSLAPKAGNYTYINPSQSLPKIISTSSSKASIAAIRSYFTDEQVIRSIAGYAGMDFDTLIGGDYKLVVEPLAYLCYNGQQFAMTATEAALYDQVVNGDLRKKLGTLTHKNLPLAIFLEEADLGYAAWSGSRTDKASNGDIISSLGIGIVRFNEVTTPPEINDFDYEYRVNTEVITSVEVRGGQSDPDNPVSVRFNIQGRTYTVSNVYYPDGDSQLAWVRWRTPAEPCVITISVSVYGGGSAQGTITCNIVDLDGNDPPNPLADDRNDAFRLSSIPEKEQVTSASWGIWSPWWQENWEWVENWQKCWHTDRWTDADGKTHTDRWYHWVDNGWWEDHGWWEFDYNSYSASLTASMRITPDEKSPTATASTLKSGYGVQEKVTAKVTTNQSAAVTAAQNAVTYFPEFGYENYWRLLEAEISGQSTTFQFKANPYSTYNRRTHFTPIWYPDGSYTPYTWLLDCWTPTGMLSMNLTDSVTIRGNLWEEWHIAPAKQR